MTKRKKQKPSPKLNWRLRDKIIAAIFTGQSLFIKNTGVKVSVDHFGDDSFSSYSRNKYKVDTCKITFETVPNSKALKLVNSYSITKNSHTKTMDSDAYIYIYIT